MRRWFFGSDNFAHPRLRWLSVPLLRVGILLVAVPIVATGHATWLSLLGVLCLGVSVAAGGYDVIERRRGRHASVH